MKCETCEDRQENEWWRAIQDRELGRYTAEWRKDTGQRRGCRPGVWSIVRWLDRRARIMERAAQLWAIGDFSDWLEVSPAEFCNLAYAIAEAEVDS